MWFSGLGFIAPVLLDGKAIYTITVAVMETAVGPIFFRKL